jgi:predicted  nucleic acid-binding Zn-ribbon protein
MEIADTIKKVIQELIVPELGHIRSENAEIKAVLQVTNKRLDDMNLHLTDLSRRIDETNKRIDHTRDEIVGLIIRMIDETNKRIDRLYEVIVRREEHEKLEIRILKLEHDILEIRGKLAA